MPQAQANGITFEYERSGPADGEPLLLIHGVGAQLIQWPPEYIAAFEKEGFSVIRFDPRDIGLSTHLDALGFPDIEGALAAHARGEKADVPYTVIDLAADVAGLIEALGLESVHVFGVSLGGIVAQSLVADHRSKVRSLTIVMSHSSNPDAPPPTPAVLTEPVPDPREDEEGFVAGSLKMFRAIASPRFPIPDERMRAFALEPMRRAFDPAGFVRQLVAGRTAPDRRAELRQLDIPAIVIHGVQDPLIPIAGGEDIAANIPGAYMVKIDGLGHDAPPQLADTFASLAALNARRARTGCA
jgi:pimeloyl-ACP methyl ester carboxylesterase